MYSSLSTKTLRTSVQPCDVCCLWIMFLFFIFLRQQDSVPTESLMENGLGFAVWPIPRLTAESPIKTVFVWTNACSLVFKSTCSCDYESMLWPHLIMLVQICLLYAVVLSTKSIRNQSYPSTVIQKFHIFYYLVQMGRLCTLY